MLRVTLGAILIGYALQVSNGHVNGSALILLTVALPLTPSASRPHSFRPSSKTGGTSSSTRPLEAWPSSSGDVPNCSRNLPNSSRPRGSTRKTERQPRNHSAILRSGIFVPFPDIWRVTFAILSSWLCHSPRFFLDSAARASYPRWPSLFLFTPRTFVVLEQARTGPFAVLFFAAVGFCTVRGYFRFLPVWVGLAHRR